MKQKDIAGPMIVDGKQVARTIDKIDRKLESQNMRIGAYYSKLKTNQKKRFQTISGAITRRFEIFARKNPLEMLLVRQIALNTIRIEEAELAILDGAKEKFLDAIEKWLFLAQKERREAISTLFNIMKRDTNKAKDDKFGDLRSLLRDEQGLEESTEESTKPSSTDRRHYDKITRTDT